jgi:hypothetical protein
MIRPLLSACMSALLLAAFCAAAFGAGPSKSNPSTPSGNSKATPGASSAQTVEDSKSNPLKAITQIHQFANSPVSIVEVMVKGRSLAMGHPITVHETQDWLKGAIVRFQNVSAKPISSLTLHVSMSAPGKPGEVIDFTLKFGQDPWQGDVHQVDSADILLPGQTADLSISDGWYDRADRVLRHSGSPALEKIQQADIELGFVYFNDNTAWHAGSFLRADPDHPGIYVVAENQGL